MSFIEIKQYICINRKIPFVISANRTICELLIYLISIIMNFFFTFIRKVMKTSRTVIFSHDCKNIDFFLKQTSTYQIETFRKDSVNLIVFECSNKKILDAWYIFQLFFFFFFVLNHTFIGALIFILNSHTVTFNSYQNLMKVRPILMLPCFVWETL